MIVVAMFAQHHHDGGDAGAEEDVRGQADDGLNVVFLHQVPANSAFLTATEQHAMWQYDGHDAVVAQMVEVMQQEGVVRLGLGRDAVFEADIFAGLRRFPVLGVGRIRDHSVHEQRLIGLILGLVGIEPRPVTFQCVSVAGHDVVRQDAAHDKIHTREIVGILLEFLCVILDVIRIAIATGHSLTDMDQQRARATRGVVDVDFFTAGEMPSHYFAHELRDFARRVELTGLLTRVGSEVAN